MDFSVNGIQYLMLDKNKDDTLNIDNDNKSKEYQYTKKWLILKHNPKTQQEIDILSSKYDLILNELFYSLTYESSSLFDLTSENDDVNDINQIKKDELKIPEGYFRFKKLLDVDFQNI